MRVITKRGGLDYVHRKTRPNVAGRPHAIARDEARAPDAGRNEGELPAPFDALRVPCEYQGSERLDRLHWKSAGATDWNFIADGKLLPLRQYAFGARRVEITEKTIEPVIAV